MFFDILGLLNLLSVQGFSCLLIVVEEYSKLRVVKFLRAKSEALKEFQGIIAKHRFPKVLRSDNGKEFTSKLFKRFCIENRTNKEYTVPETLEQNATGI